MSAIKFNLRQPPSPERRAPARHEPYHLRRSELADGGDLIHLGAGILSGVCISLLESILNESRHG